MKRQTMRTLLLALIVAAMTSCSEDGSPDVGKGGSDVAGSTREIEQLVNDYYREVVSSTRADGGAPEILDVSTKRYPLYAESEESTKPMKVNSVGEAIPDYFEIKTVKLDFGDTEGFAIASDTPGVDKVFFMTESGAISDTTYNKALALVINSYPDVARDMLLNPEDGTRALPEYVIINKIVRYQWGQGYPYNRNGTYCTCTLCSRVSHKNHKPIGCVTTAMAQTIATVGKFKGTFYGTKDINFSSLHNKSGSMSSAEILQIARFFQEIALNCQVKFGCKGSGTTAKAAYNYLKDLGYDCTYDEGAINPIKVIARLGNGIPHLIAGQGRIYDDDVSYESGGHMWVIDGVKVKNDEYQYHCNWGWDGLDDGWTSSSPFDTHHSPSIYFDKNFKHIYISSK